MTKFIKFKKSLFYLLNVKNFSLCLQSIWMSYIIISMIQQNDL